MKPISLTRGYVAIVDDEDFENANRFRWSARVQKTGNVYAGRTIRIGNTNQTVFLHRFILGEPSSEIDHIDGDGLNCCRSNLRPATTSQNQQNRTRLPTNTSGYRGVTWNKRLRKWQAQIKLRGRNYYLGLHSTREAAARAYDQQAAVLFGDFGRTNQPEIAA